MSNSICKSMRSTITQILKAHNLLDQFNAASGFYAKVGNEPYMPLCIERHGTQITLTHYFKQNGDLIPDPDMEFEVGADGEWYPVAIQFAIGTYRRCVTENDDGQLLINQHERIEQKEFSDMWAKNLKDQGFHKGTILKTSEN